MKRTTHLLSTTALGLALLTAPALAQRTDTQRMGGGDMPSSAPTSGNRTAAEVDRLHKGNGTNGGPADLLLQAQGALRGGRTGQATELLERAETRLLTGVEPTKPAQGDPAFHIAEARRALAARDRAEAMRHTNMAIATVREGGTLTGSDPIVDRRATQGGGGPGMVDTGMGTPPPGTGRAVIRDSGSSGTTTSRAEAATVLAQSTPSRSGTPSGAPAGTPSGPPVGAPAASPRSAPTNAPTGLPPGDTLPGWSGPRGGASGAAPQSLSPGGASPPFPTAPSAGVPGASPPAFGSRAPLAGPSSSSITGGEAARLGGSPPADTSRSPGSSGIGGSGVGGPLR